MVEITRERLFELIWSEPTTTVAKRLGISDVALGKLCRQRQVPKPPRGYWARKQAGKRVRRPPLPAFREAVEREGYKVPNTGGGRETVRHRLGCPRLSPRKRELFDHAVRHLRGDATTKDDFTISSGRLAWIDPDFAAAVVVAVGQHYRRWCLREGAGMRAEQALDAMAARLIDELLPLARERIIVFSPADPANSRMQYTNPDQHVVVRFTPELVRTVARLAMLVRDEGMAFAACELGSANQFWRARWVRDPGKCVHGRTTLCVSPAEIWIRYDGLSGFGEADFLESAAVPLETIVPMDELGRQVIETTVVTARTHQEPYASELQALARAEQAFDIAEHAWLNVDKALEKESLTKVLALWWDEGQLDALHRVRSGLRDTETSMETWREALDQEREAVARKILGIRIGDCVSVESGGQRIVLKLEGVDLLFPEDRDELVFFLRGARYRKDGLPGKRQDQAAISVSWKRMS